MPEPGRRGPFSRSVMYTAHFGLTDPPFSITPDPRYLYMSDRHREGIAHLVYGIGEGGGFVQLTGEVGTGKTTLCRCLLEQLPAEVDVALILNPKLTDIELLAAVCDELRIAYPTGTTSRKLLIDKLYQYLLDAHGRDRRTVLIIDEAQDLAPEVLEQIRLLTNLETTTEKLLQIILIGQPELIRLLDREDLRQLAQRVIARYHLLPFSEDDTYAYIRHRMEVAGQKEKIFSVAAMRQVHRASRGIPRLINVICDRAMLGAYAQHQRRVDEGTVRRAAREVLGRPIAPRSVRPWQWAAAGAGAAAVAAATWVLLTHGQFSLTGGVASNRTTGPPAAMSSAAAPALQDGEGTEVAPGETAPPVPVATGREVKPATPKPDALRCLFRSGTWAKLRRIDMPAIIELATPTWDRRYATVVAIDDQTATLDFGGRRHIFPLSEVNRYWDGPFILLWKAPALTSLFIEPGTRSRDVEWVRQRLSEIDGAPGGGKNREVFDDALRARVLAFQRSRSLVPDGIVGEETLIQLSSAPRDPSVPRLSSPRS